MADEDKKVNGDASENGDQDKAPDQGAQIPKARFDELNAKKKAAEEALRGVVAELVEDLPEDMRELVPNLPPAEQVKWIRQATKKGLFAKQPPNGPDSKRPGGKPPQDWQNLPAAQRRELGYKS